MANRLKDLKGDWHEYESKMERRKERDKEKKRVDGERKKAKEAKEARDLERKRSAGLGEMGNGTVPSAATTSASLKRKSSDGIPAAASEAKRAKSAGEGAA